MLCGSFDPSVDKLKDNRGTGTSRDRSFKFGHVDDQRIQGV